MKKNKMEMKAIWKYMNININHLWMKLPIYWLKKN